MNFSLFFKVLSIEARVAMSYRFDFWIKAVVSFITEFGAVWFLWNALFLESEKKEIGGYDLQNIVLYYLAVILIGKIVRGSRSKDDVSQDIYQGRLNKYLIIPIDYIFYKYAQYLGAMVPAMIQFILFGIMLIFFLDIPEDLNFSMQSVVMAIFTIAMANVLYFQLDFLLKLSAFWLDNVWSLDSFKWFVVSLFGGYLIPLSVFPEKAETILEYLPFKYLFDFPINVLFGKLDFVNWIQQIFILIIWCAVFILCSKLVWKKGIHQYSGVGI